MSHIILIGPPGCGKGTLSQYIIKDNKKIEHISTGELLRTKKDKDIENILKKGLFVSDECITKLVHDKIEESDNILLLDGYPRTLNQASNFNIKYVKLVIVLQVKDNTCIERIQGRKDKREDDKDVEIIKKRINIYHSMTEPVIEYYNKYGLVEYVDGSDEPEKVYEKIKDIINKREV